MKIMSPRAGSRHALIAVATGCLLFVPRTACAHDLVIHAGMLVDGVRKTPWGPASIIVHDDRIVSVAQGFVSPPGAEVVDLSQATVLPGLIDTHVHLTDPDGPDPVTWQAQHSVLEQELASVPHARKTLMAGFTSVRNVAASSGTDIALKRAIEAGDVEGPRMWVSLEAIGPSGGHSDPRNGFSPAISDRDWGGSVADGPDEVRKLVREHRRDGADLIKIMPSGGVLTVGDDPARQLMTDEEIEAAIDTAHGLGMKVAAHAHGKAAIDTATKLGIDSIEHGSYADAGSFQLMKQHGTYLVPTLLVAATASEMARAHPEQMSPSTVAKALTVAPHALEMCREAYRSGVRIAFGTDTGAGPSPAGDNAKEFALLVQAGMTPMDAILAATANAADLIGDKKDIGTIEAGKYADIVAVRGDVTANISLLEHVKFVMKGGHVVNSEM